MFLYRTFFIPFEQTKSDFLQNLQKVEVRTSKLLAGKADYDFLQLSFMTLFVKRYFRPHFMIFQMKDLRGRDGFNGGARGAIPPPNIGCY